MTPTGIDWAELFEDADETLLWEGRPLPDLSLAPVRHITNQLVLVWGIGGGVATLMMAAVAPFVAPWMALGTAAFIGLQLWIAATVNAGRRKRAYYAVTDRRVLILRLPSSLDSLRPLDPEAVRLEPGATGSVVVGRSALTYHLESGGKQTTWREHRLDLIPEAEQVAELVRQTAARNAPDRPEDYPWSVKRD